MLKLGLVPETFPTILAAVTFEDLYFGSSEPCSKDPGLKFNNRVKTNSSYQIFSAQTVAGELEEVNREVLNDVAMDVLGESRRSDDDCYRESLLDERRRVQ